jgi:molybdate transport system substrate-binding protein
LLVEAGMRRIARGLTALLLMALACGLGGKAQAQAAPPLFMAPASLKNALDQIAGDWKTETGKTVTFSFAASSALAKQIEQGAPADLFASADLDWMDYLDQRGLIRPGTRSNLLGNSLVLIAPADLPRSFALTKGADLGAFVGDGRLAVADVNAVPAGKYAKQALQALDLWTGVENKLAQSDNVRATLALVARGEAVAGIVYATDANSEARVKVLGTFPADSHAPIVYPVAIVATSTHADAQTFLTYLRSPAARRAYATHGFHLP